MSHLRAGELNRLVTVQQRATTQDSFGAQQFTWSDLKQVYGHIEALTGRQLLAAQAVANEVSHQITLRYDAIWADPRVAAAYRIVYNGRLFDIHAVQNEDERDRVVTLLASEGLSQG